jgi:chromosomal replication initiation ATPase DnaA
MVDGRDAGKDLDVPEARAMRGRGWGVGQIVPVVAEAWRIPVEAVRRREGEQPARAVAMYLAARRGKETYGQIGQALDGVRYSAVAKAVKRLEARLERDAALRTAIQTCERRLDESKVKL